VEVEVEDRVLDQLNGNMEVEDRVLDQLNGNMTGPKTESIKY